MHLIFRIRFIARSIWKSTTGKGEPEREQAEYDEEGTNYFRSQGYEVIRLWNNAVMNGMIDVLPVITQTLEEKM